MKKNICFFISDISNIGGTERVSSIIANELARLNEKYNIIILSVTNCRNEIPFKIEKNIELYNIFDNEISFRKKYINLVLYVRKFIKQKNIDIIIDVDTILDLITIPALTMSKTRLISWEHFCYHGNSNVKSRKLARKLAAKFSDYIITLTEEDKEAFKTNLSISCPIQCIYNPIINRKEDKRYSIESKVILSIGRLTEQKGFDMLVDVANNILPNREGWKWIILGEGEDRAILEKKINMYGLEDKVILKGNVLNVEDYYKNASIFVSTSRYEGLPLVLLEGKSYGLPLVSFNCKTGPSEIINDNYNGYLVNCFDIDDMSIKLNLLIDDKNLRKDFSNKSVYGIDKFEISHIINKWERIISDLC